MAASTGLEASGWGELAVVWLLFGAGVLVGQLLPRSRAARALFPRASPGSIASVLSRWYQVVLAYHAVVLLRTAYRAVLRPGAGHGVLRACVQGLCGRGFTFAWPGNVADAEAALLDATPSEAAAEPGRAAAEWYVTEKDLAFFNYHALEGGACDSATPWEVTLEKDVPGLVRYTAWRRTLPCGKTEYKSVTLSPDVTPFEFMDLYLDDSFRRVWDGMVIHHEVLEHGSFAERQQVVRWIRRFPFAFLSDREYAIARRLFRGPDGSLTACTKAIAHPREVRNGAVVRMDVFWSHWRSRAVPCPWGSGKPATETVLLHHEQFKIPERLARFAVSHGMWQFVRKLASTVPQYVEARRKRCDPSKEDPAAYGAGHAPNPPSRGELCDGGSSSGGSSSSGASGSGGSEFGGSSCSGYGAGAGYQPRRRRLPAAAAVALVGGVALLARRGGSTSGPDQQARGAGAARRTHRHGARREGHLELLQ